MAERAQQAAQAPVHRRLYENEEEGGGEEEEEGTADGAVDDASV